MRLGEFAKNAVLLIVSTALSFGLVEASYRAWLYYKEPQRFRQHDPRQDPTISFISPAPTVFNARYGFDYTPNRTFIAGGVTNGRLAGCVELKTNSVGAWNVEPGDWGAADIKALVVGDSMTAMASAGVSWTDVMGRRLAELTGKTVAVRNLARDGQGVLQMIDIAAGELSKLHPTLVIIGYITDDITRARIWRRNEILEGKLRNFVTILGNSDFDPMRSVDTQVVIPEPVAMEWCRRLPAPDRNDPIIRDAEDRHALAVSHAKARIDLFTITRSLVMDQLIHGDPFYYYYFIKGSAVSVLPRHSFVNFLDDPRTRENLRMLRDSGVPIALFHIALRGELKRGAEFIFGNEKLEGALINSLEDALGVSSILTRDNARAVDDIDKIALSSQDDHPSRIGMDFYGIAAANGLIRAGLITGTVEQSEPVNKPAIGRIEGAAVILDGRSYPILRRIGGTVESMSDLYRGVELTGWVVDIAANGPAIAIVAAVESNIVARAEPTTRRPDIEQGIGSGIIPAGFVMAVPVPRRSEPAKIRVFALTADGHAVQLASSLPAGQIAAVDPMKLSGD